jgi:hypothetical protein
MAEEKTPQFRLTRPSASADASEAGALERLAKMSVRERMQLALRLGARLRSVQARFGQHEADGDGASP